MIFELTALDAARYALHVDGKQALPPLTAHAVKDLEFALAMHTAGSARCPARCAPGDGEEHACALWPGHTTPETRPPRSLTRLAGFLPHSCRACTLTWNGNET